MNSKTFVSAVIILLAIFSMITYYKMKDFPYDNNCCKDIKSPSSTVCHTCNDYSLPEKIIYVWKFS